MSKERRNISAQDKVAILRRHLVDKTPVSDLCDEHQIQPAQFYQWQKQFFENGAAAFGTAFNQSLPQCRSRRLWRPEVCRKLQRQSHQGLDQVLRCQAHP